MQRFLVEEPVGARDPGTLARPRVGLRTTKFVATHLETGAQIEALMEAAGQLDLIRRGRQGHGRALVAVLVMAGLRIGELRELRWGDVYLSKSYLYVRGTKTESAERRVALVPGFERFLLS